MRFDIDKRSRGAYLYMMKKENLLQLPPPVAEKLIGEFLEADRDKADPASNVQQLAKSKPYSPTEHDPNLNDSRVQQISWRYNVYCNSVASNTRCQ